MASKRIMPTVSAAAAVTVVVVATLADVSLAFAPGIIPQTRHTLRTPADFPGRTQPHTRNRACWKPLFMSRDAESAPFGTFDSSNPFDQKSCHLGSNMRRRQLLLPAAGCTSSRAFPKPTSTQLFMAQDSAKAVVEEDDDENRRSHGKGIRNGFMAALTDTKFDKAIFSLAIPALGSLIIEPVVRTVEAVMVGRLGAAPLGALSIGGSVVSVSFPLFNFFFLCYDPHGCPRPCPRRPQ